MATDKPHQAVSSAEQTVQSTTERVARAAHEAIDSLSGYGGRTEERLRETGRRAGETTREYADELSGYVSKRPLAALAIALGVGFFMGMLSRGRD
ncbi:hypothetical protein SVA_2290 [Sulfurifustis variabilis]|uniref:DUF883 domain-containing protein n=1 Tax=Sulfurifustis variabilis TaxID=1675686 RepID=A0A1B4V5L6_9GAMM|nr:DUF883 family protein [Sulfurifustis variabilis]BAU48840.1 hypothetical protein SVA_2290 [Sulfurifustis variabilis]